MKDNEIIKALERCRYHSECCYCNSVEECGSKRVLVDNSLDLINRQQAEIERLQKENNLYSDLAKMGDALKSEAIKEFAESILELFPSDKNFTTISRFTIKQKLKEFAATPTPDASVSLIDGHIDGKEFWNDTH
jgi:hypothetical protein